MSKNLLEKQIKEVFAVENEYELESILNWFKQLKDFVKIPKEISDFTFLFPKFLEIIKRTYIDYESKIKTWERKEAELIKN